MVVRGDSVTIKVSHLQKCTQARAVLVDAHGDRFQLGLRLASECETSTDGVWRLDYALQVPPGRYYVIAEVQCPGKSDWIPSERVAIDLQRPQVIRFLGQPRGASDPCCDQCGVVLAPAEKAEFPQPAPKSDEPAPAPKENGGSAIGLKTRVSVNGRFDSVVTGSFTGDFDGDFDGEFRGDFEGKFTGTDGTMPGVPFEGKVSTGFRGTGKGKFNGTFDGKFKGTFRGTLQVQPQPAPAASKPAQASTPAAGGGPQLSQSGMTFRRAGSDAGQSAETTAASVPPAGPALSDGSQDDEVKCRCPGQTQTIVIASAANFPLPEFGQHGQRFWSEGAIVYENMQVIICENGQYEVRGKVSTPMTTQFRLQLLLSMKDGTRYTLTLPTKTITLGSDAGRDQQTAVQPLTWRGTAPALIGMTQQVEDVRRYGTARFGSLPPTN